MPGPSKQDAQDIAEVVAMTLDRAGGHTIEIDEVLNTVVSPDLKQFRDPLPTNFLNRLTLQGLLDFQFFGGAKIYAGGTGIVLQVKHPIIPVHYALKFSRPSLMRNGEDAQTVANEAKNEFFRHGPLSHQNVARVFGTMPILRHEPQSFRPIQMEWIEGKGTNSPQTLQEYILTLIDAKSLTGLVDVARQAFVALDYIHSRNLIHWDIKSTNLLVDKNNTLKLMDIGNARSTIDKDRGLVAFTTKGNHPASLDPVGGPRRRGGGAQKGTTNRWPVNLPSLSWDCPWLDMWMLSRDLMALFRSNEEPYFSNLSKYHQDDVNEQSRLNGIKSITSNNDDQSTFYLNCLRLILRRILIFGSPEANAYYSTADEVVHDLEKILPEFGGAQMVTELHSMPRDVLRVPVMGNVGYTRRVAGIYNATFNQRLAHHLQLATVFHAYPGGAHRRSEHVAGVALTICEYARALYADRTNPFWRLVMEAVDIEALLFAALVHDMGHVAFGHFLEEMEGLTAGRDHEDYVLGVLDPHRFGSTFVTGSRLASGDRSELEGLATDWFGDLLQPRAGAGPRDVNSFLAYVAQIIRPDPLPSGFKHSIYSRTECNKMKLHVLHSLLDGGLDADKLDYLRRDAWHTGVQYASGIDVDRLLQTLTVVSLNMGESSVPAKVRTRRTSAAELPGVPCLGVSRDGILPLESLLIARYQMYRSVYWHHTTRAETTMLQHLILEFVWSFGRKTLGRTVEERIARVLDEFRSRTDTSAINWVREAIEREGGRLGGKWDALLRICEGLRGNREFLYRRAVELDYSRKDRSTRRTLYNWLTDWSSAVNKEPVASKYIEAVRTRAAKLTERFGDEFKSRFKHGDILLDIPPSRQDVRNISKDQVKNLYVTDGASIYPLEDVSPMGETVREIFQYWTRSIRIYMRRDVLNMVTEQRRIDRAELNWRGQRILQSLYDEERMSKSIRKAPANAGAN